MQCMKIFFNSNVKLIPSFNSINPTQLALPIPIQYQSNQVLTHTLVPYRIISIIINHPSLIPNPLSINLHPSTMTHIEYNDLIALDEDSEERRDFTSVHIPDTVTAIVHTTMMMMLVSRTAQLWPRSPFLLRLQK